MGNIQTHSMTVGSLLDNDFSETSSGHEFATITSNREGPIDCWDLSLLGKEGGGKLKYVRYHDVTMSSFFTVFLWRMSLKDSFTGPLIAWGKVKKSCLE